MNNKNTNNTKAHHGLLHYHPNCHDQRLHQRKHNKLHKFKLKHEHAHYSGLLAIPHSKSSVSHGAATEPSEEISFFLTSINTTVHSKFSHSLPLKSLPIRSNVHPPSTWSIPDMLPPPYPPILFYDDGKSGERGLQSEVDIYFTSEGYRNGMEF
jgi:hypothetical protein